MAAKQKTSAKPRKDYPLFFHKGTRQWCKKVAQKFYYFGTDAEEAERRWDREKERITAGEPIIPESTGGKPLGDIINEFLEHKRSLVGTKITAYTFSDCFRTCETLVKHFGRDSKPVDYRPGDFGRFYAKLAQTKKSPVTMANTVIRVRSFFNWALANKYMLTPANYGTQFEIPGSKEKRRAKNQAKRAGQGRVFTAEECLKIIDAARQPLKAMILLGLNGGFGQSDIGNLPREAVDLNTGWIDFPRVKTEEDRLCPLWPETVAALKDSLFHRPEPVNPADAHLVFLTAKGNPWIQQGEFVKKTLTGGGKMFFRNDNVGKEFDKLLVSLELKRRGSFYNLRHCFRTAAANAKDREATDLIMGHTDPTMGGNYVHAIDRSRLEAVVNVVRSWLFTPEPVEGSGDAADGTILPFKAAVG